MSIRICLFHALMLWLAAGAAAPECESPVGQVISLQGRAELKAAGTATWEPAAGAAELCAGDSLRVGRHSRAAVRLANDTVVRLDQGAAMTFLPVADGERSWLEVLEGAVHLISRVPRSLGVRTPFLNAAVEGTEFLVEVGAGAARVSVYEGRVRARAAGGTVTASAGDAVLGLSGRTPRRLAAEPLQDALRWALYYPPLLEPARVAASAPQLSAAAQAYRGGDPGEALSLLEALPEHQRDARFYRVQAAWLASVGQVDAAEEAIDRLMVRAPGDGTGPALRAVMALARGDLAGAGRLAARAESADPRGVAPRVARSYVQQAAFELDDALAAVRAASGIAPRNALVRARIAELWLAKGYLVRALAAARSAVSLDPRLARTQSVLGFAHLTRIEIGAAEEAFRRATELDPADPLPRLGLGLARIRAGDLVAGRKSIEAAVALDPASALLRSYLGKAYFEEGRDRLAGGQYALARGLDPRDPTPWFYDGIRKQLANRPAEALQDLSAAIERNDNRAVYRSRLMLDRDLATRGVSLARTYGDLGFDAPALVAGAASLAIDPTDHSAHRFLSDTYARLPRHEIARVSELLQAQLLQPLNVSPVQPSLAVSDLSLIAAAGPAQAGLHEYSSLFEREGPRLTVSGIAGDEDTWGEEVVVSGIFGPVSYSAGQMHSETGGFDPNRFVRNDLADLFVQAAVSPELSVQAEYRHRETERGDLELRFDPAPARDLRNDVEQETGRIGARYAMSPRADLIASFLYSDRREENQEPGRLGPFAFTLDDATFDEGHEAEAQVLYRGEHLNLTAGAGTYDVDVERRTTFDFSPLPCPAPRCEEATEFASDQFNAYLYANGHLPHGLTLSAGVGYDEVEEEDRFRFEEFNPKLGLQWQVNPAIRIRAAGFETIKRRLIVDQTIEPTQVAGFNQFFDDPNGTRAARYAGAVDLRLGGHLFGGVEVSRRELETPTVDEQLGRTRIEDRQESLYRAYFHWTSGARWAVSAEVRREDFELESTPLSVGAPTRVDTMELPIGVRYFHPDGLFGALTATYVEQDVDRSVGPPAGIEGDGDEFWLVDARIGVRLAGRKGILTLEARNILDREFTFQDDNFRNSEVRASRFAPDRSIALRATLSF